MATHVASLQVWTPASDRAGSGCGWGSFGWADPSTWLDPDRSGCLDWELPVSARRIAGDAGSVAADLQRVRQPPRSALVIGTGLEPVLDAIAQRWPDLPVSGGGSDAIAPLGTVLVVLLDAGIWEAEHLNVHEHCLHLWKPLNNTIPLPPSHFV